VQDVAAGRPLVVVRTFSKTWSMAAARLGYCVAPPEVVEVLDKVALPYHLDAAKQLAGELALDFEAEKVWQGLLDQSVLVRDCSSWPRLGGCLRITIGTPDEDDAFLAALTEVLT
jgi:histidinol-phosphate aminotransferase